MFKSKFSIYVYCILLRSVNFQTNVEIDVNGITDFQNLLEYFNNKKLGIFVFESDVFINQGESPFNAWRIFDSLFRLL